MIFEIFIILVILWIIFYFLIQLIQNIKKKRLLKKYNPDNDNSRKREETRESGGGNIDESVSISPRQDKPVGRDLLPPSNVNLSGQNSGNVRKSDKLSNFLSRLSKK